MNALIAVANGSEEMETVITADMLVRADIQVTIASVEDKTIIASRGVRIETDALIADVVNEKFDVVICPGGLPGAKTLQQSEALKSLLIQQDQQQKWVAAICAAPAYVLAHHQLLNDRHATCYPDFKDKLPNFVDRAVVVSKNVITSQGPGTAFLFATEIIKQLRGKAVAEQVAANALIV